MATFRATFDFTRTAVGMLSFRSGDEFTVRNRTNADWWTVEDSKGEMGLVPVSYLEAVATPPVSETQTHIQPAKQNGVMTEEVYSSLYDFTGQDSTQLTFKQGEKLWLVSKSDKSWWTMHSASGSSGLVPINYIDKIESKPPSVIHSDSEPHPQGSESLSEVLLSIDRAMQKIHDESVVRGGTYSADQRSALQRLTAHRQFVLNGAQSTPSPTTQLHTSTPSPSHNSTTTIITTNPHHSHPSPAKSSRPKRQAPPPPRNSPKNSLSKRDKRKSMPPKGQGSPARDIPTTEYESQTLPGRGDAKRRSRSNTQPHGLVDAREKSKSISQIDQGRAVLVSGPGGGEREGRRGRAETDHSVGLSEQRASSETFMNGGGTGSQLAHSSQLLPVSRTSSSPGKVYGHRYSAEPHTSSNHHPHQHSFPSSSSSSPLMQRKYASIDALPGDQKTQKSPGRVPSPRFSPMGSPATQRRLRSNSSRSVVSLPEHPEQLPIQFSALVGAEFVEVVRSRTNLSYAKSLQAVAGVLEVLKNKVPQCEAMVDGLLTAVRKSQGDNSPSTSRKLEKTHDMERLKEIFFQLQEVREDSQQRGWAVHDDQGAIMEYLQELLQILCDADPEVSKSAVQEDKYENVLILISYFDIETRTPIRLLLLQVFGVLCGLDREIISVLLSSILPNELGRDIQDNLTEIEKTLYSSTVCTMIFSTGEAIPLSVYDQWSEQYVSFLLDTIEAPPDEDADDQVADAFLNVVLSFNQHFQDPDTNLVMSALKQKSNPRNFSEKFMFLINRGEDPVMLQDPCSPDSLTKFALDIFSSKETSRMFYTTDLKVLVDIVLRQISDLSSGDETRTHFLELLYRIVSSTDYTSHEHKRPEITAVLTRIAQEGTAESLSDKAIIKKIWLEHSGCFDEVTDL